MSPHDPQSPAGESRPARRLLKMGEVEHRVGLDKRTIHRKVKAESFPKPVPLGDRRIGFLEHEIEAWIDARISERDGGAA